MYRVNLLQACNDAVHLHLAVLCSFGRAFTEE